MKKTKKQTHKPKKKQAGENVKDRKVVGISVEKIWIHEREVIIYDRIKIPVFKKNLLL